MTKLLTPPPFSFFLLFLLVFSAQCSPDLSGEEEPGTVHLVAACRWAWIVFGKGGKRRTWLRQEWPCLVVIWDVMAGRKIVDHASTWSIAEEINYSHYVKINVYSYTERIISVDRKRTEELPPNIRALQQNNDITIKLTGKSGYGSQHTLNSSLACRSFLSTLIIYINQLAQPPCMLPSIHWFNLYRHVLAGSPCLGAPSRCGKSITNPCNNIDRRATIWLWDNTQSIPLGSLSSWICPYIVIAS